MRGFKSIKIFHIENARAAWVRASPSVPPALPPALRFGRRLHPRRPHPQVTLHPVLPQGYPGAGEHRGGGKQEDGGRLSPRQALGEPAAGETHSVSVLHQKFIKAKGFFFLFYFFYETVEMTQRFLTQSPFHRKIPNQLLVATDCSHKSRSVIPGRSSAAYAAPARPREISRSDAIASVGAKTAPKTKRTGEQIQNMSLRPASRQPNPTAPMWGWTGPCSCHPKTPGASAAPKTPGAAGAAAEAAGRYSINHRQPGSDDSVLYLPVFGISVRNYLQMLFTAFGLGVN